MREIRDALHRWMTAVMEERGWTAGAWARRAGVTATNLTRFLRAPATASVPSAVTLGRLARAAWSEPRFLPWGPSRPPARVPVLEVEDLRAAMALAGDDLADFLDRRRTDGAACIAVDRRVSPRALAVRIGSQHLNAGGVIVDDLVVVEPAADEPPRPGDLVVVIEGDRACGYRCHPPQLVPVSTDARCVPVPVEGAAIVGVAVHLWRDLRPERAAGLQVRGETARPEPNMGRRRGGRAAAVP